MSNIPVTNVDIPRKTRNITVVITEVYNKIKGFFAENKTHKLTFSQLIPSDSKEDKVYTFIPLLHLDSQRKIDIYQYQHFGEIGVSLRRTEQELKKELVGTPGV